MYRRFLNNSDYLGIITQDSLSQITRNEPETFIQAEEAAEMSVIEYLSENYEIEKELKQALLKELKRSEDPRIVGPDKEIFESYIRYSPIREFPKPDWAE